MMAAHSTWISRTRQRVPYGVRRVFRHRWHAVQMFTRLAGVHPRTCPICGYHGKFHAFGVPLVLDVMCARCDSLDRHRLFVLMDDRHQILSGVKSMLHFAPEDILRKKFSRRFPEYRAVDLVRVDVDYQCNIEDTQLPTASVDAVFASHILEHVDDRKAVAELFRILKPGGRLIAMVPIIEAWAETYENRAIASESDRDLHFGQYDHVRFYGRDFPQRLEAAGFAVSVYMATPLDCVTYGLQRGEKVFVATKP
jgi:SAM-dependent methyltransferase